MVKLKCCSACDINDYIVVYQWHLIDENVFVKVSKFFFSSDY